MKNYIEVDILNKDNFLKIKETLERIGISNKDNTVLYQTAHILHKQNKYYVMHFKEMFELDGRETDISDEDLGRRNRIISLLEDWGLLKILSDKKLLEPKIVLSKIKIVKHKDKADWKFESKYTIGKKK
jgi:hypothetical protein